MEYHQWLVELHNTVLAQIRNMEQVLVQRTLAHPDSWKLRVKHKQSVQKGVFDQARRVLKAFSPTYRLLCQKAEEIHVERMVMTSTEGKAYG